jgi:hypothetical protein
LLARHKRRASLSLLWFGWLVYGTLPSSGATTKIGRKHMDLSTLVGLAMVAGALLVFAFGLQWGGQIRNERMHASVLMVLIATFFVGAAFALMGFPEPIKISTSR